MKNILVVDDEPAVLTLMCHLVKAAMYNPIKADNALQAIMVLEKSKRIDAMVLDIHMPELNGVELAKLVRLTRPTMPILFVTGLGEIDGVVSSDFFDGPGLHYLAKPFTNQAFKDNVNSMFN